LVLFQISISFFRIFVIPSWLLSLSNTNLSDCFRNILYSFESFWKLLETIRNIHDYIMNLCDANIFDMWRKLNRYVFDSDLNRSGIEHVSITCRTRIYNVSNAYLSRIEYVSITYWTRIYHISTTFLSRFHHALNAYRSRIKRASIRILT
jgi:hypothetical protein